MVVKAKFDKLLKQVTDVDSLIQQVTVVGKKEQLISKLKSIKQKCNQIVIPKVTVRQAAYDTSIQPMVPITGQSRLAIKSIRSILDDKNYYVSHHPEDWDITWETGALDTCIVEYTQNENQNPDFVLPPIYVEVYDLQQCLQPLFGTGNLDVDENYQQFGDYLGCVDSTKHLSGDKKDFQGELIIPSIGRRVHVSETTTPSVTGESVVQEGDIFTSKRYKSSTDYAWYECTGVKVQGTVLTVQISGSCKDHYFRPTEMWTSWKKFELRSGGTIKCMMATIQADGSFELVVADEKDPLVHKVKELIQRIYIDKE